MTSIYAAFAFLCICLFAQAPAEGALTKITSLKRIEKGNNFTFIAEYERGTDLQIKWDHTSPAVLTQEPGRFALTTQKVGGYAWGERVVLFMGNFKSQYVRIDFNTKHDGNQSMDNLDYALSTVTPSTDLAYTPGTTEDIVVSVPKNRGQLYFARDYYRLNPVARYFDHKANRTVRSQGAPFLTRRHSHTGDVRTSTVIFHSDDIIDGWFPAYLGTEPKDRTNTPVQRMREDLVFTVHPPNKPVSISVGVSWSSRR